MHFKLCFPEHSSYFTADVEGNRVTLTMGSLDENIINENSFVNVAVSATTGRSTTTCYRHS